MHAELNRTLACVDRLDTAARASRWHLDRIGDERASIAPVWNDACAREFAQRYLTPMTEEAGQALAAITQAGSDLRTCADAVQHAQESFETAVRLNRIVQAAIQEGHSLLRSIALLADQAFVHIETSRQQAAHARSLLAQADAAGAAGAG